MNKRTRIFGLAGAAVVGVGLVAQSGFAPALATHSPAEHVTLSGANTNANPTVASMADVVTITGADSYRAAGVTGSGVDVAVIDSGVAPVPGLADPDKVVFGPDYSDDGTSLDLVGHGT